MRSERSVFLGTSFSPFRATARANIAGVQWGASRSFTMIASVNCRTRSRSVRDLLEVIARFMLCSLADGNDTDLVTALCMRHGYELVLQKPQCQEALRSIALRVSVLPLIEIQTAYKSILPPADEGTC